MRDFNEFQLVGRLGADPETRYSKSGTAFTRISLANQDDYFDKNNNEWVERTNWFSVTFIGDSGVRVAEKLGKGDKVLVKCNIRPTSYEKDGVKVYSHDFTGQMYWLLEKRSTDSPQGPTNGVDKQTQSKVVQSTIDDDVPF